MNGIEMKMNANGDKLWYLNGKLHRTDGPAVEFVDGDKYWYLNGKLHRENGPAVEMVNGDKEWYLNGERHRIDGPAVEWVSETKYWFLNGKKLTEEEWQAKVFKVSFDDIFPLLDTGDLK